MATFTQLTYHIVFSTKNRKKVLNEENKKELFKYLWGIIENKKGYLYRINGVEDHIHLLVSIRPTESISNFIKDLKVSSNLWIKERGVF